MGFFSSIKKIFGSEKKKRLINELNLEITHSFPLNKPDLKFMEWSTYLEISKYFDLAKRIHFNGWGDPLLHPKFLEMLKKAKENTVVDITTYGNSLTPEVSTELVNMGINTVTINFMPPKTCLSDFLKNLLELLKKKNNETKVKLNFIMTKENIFDLPEVIDLAGEIQLNEVMASNIEFIYSSEKNEQKIYDGVISEANRGDLIQQGKNKGKKEYVEIVTESERSANNKGLYFNARPLVTNEAVMCEYSPLNNVFINYEGLVAPCKYLALQEKATIYFNNEEHIHQPFITGDLKTSTLNDIWYKEEYQQFRKCYEKRVKVFNTYMEETFEDEPTADLIYKNYKKLDEQLALYKLPEVCRKCYKAYGI